MFKIMLKNLRIVAQSIITTYKQICMNKSLLIADNLERLFYQGVFINGRLYVLLNNDCSIRVYQSFVSIFQKYILLCWHYVQCCSVTYYAQKLCWHNRLVSINKAIIDYVLTVSIHYGNCRHCREYPKCGPLVIEIMEILNTSFFSNTPIIINQNIK